MAGESYNSENGRTESVKYVYNENTKKWESVTVQGGSNQGGSNDSSSKVTAQDLINEVGDVTLPGDSDKKTKEKKPKKEKTESEKKAEKEYIEHEYITLQGDAGVLPSTKTLRLEHSKTVILTGIGKYLSGQYFIESVKRSLNNGSGYAQSCTFIKTGFGDSLKGGKTQQQSGGQNPLQNPLYNLSQTQSEGGTNRPLTLEVTDKSDIKDGDKVKFVGDNAIYALSQEGVKVPEWVIKKDDLTVSKISEDGVLALVQPINLWTYTKYLKKI